MIYAFDVTNPASPTFKWKAGCPNLTDDVGWVLAPSMACQVIDSAMQVHGGRGVIAEALSLRRA